MHDRLHKSIPWKQALRGMITRGVRGGHPGTCAGSHTTLELMTIRSVSRLDIIAQRVTALTETHGLLPGTQMGARQKRSRMRAPRRTGPDDTGNKSQTCRDSA
ncbi:hypothetical protein CERZMDRAFT_96223 [Cercospora zeae-maydis SCOH1-5]|uniref:Uncharacterized protein n=1 Tax=Cercospora zeae-maydis SCOH1-5 TaxID=717836 RepID=A0A6A6FIZ5_9PEZI|nr:hypothetical protein CERZMDRAFT_96223 [Cercospora zeae-maydis SCOH1-5]